MNLNLIAPINESSYGLTSKNILSSLVELGCDVSLFLITATKESVGEIEKKCLKNAELFDRQAPSVRIWHQHDMSIFPNSKGKKLGFPIFELDRFNQQEKHNLEACDELIVCSQWAKQICLDNLRFKPEEVHVVNLGHDNNIFYPATHKTDKFVFLNVGKWEVRKGHDILIKAFNVAFKGNKDVELWMCPHNRFLNEYQINSWEQFYKFPNVRIFERKETQQEVAFLMQKADCGVFPSRAEGWNLEAIEMMACGKDIIITDCTAHTEYIRNVENACSIISAKEKILAQDGIWFHGQGFWHKPNFEELVEAMREKYRKGKQNGYNQEAIRVAKEFTWQNSAIQTLRATT